MTTHSHVVNNVILYLHMNGLLCGEGVHGESTRAGHAPPSGPLTGISPFRKLHVDYIIVTKIFYKCDIIILIAVCWSNQHCLNCLTFIALFSNRI